MTPPLPDPIAGGGPTGGRPDGSGPALSAVLVTPGGPRAIDKILRRLHAQTIRDRIEVVVTIVGGGTVSLGAVPTADFAGVQVLRADRAATSAQARAEAVRAAHAPVVALIEDHSFPEPTWAERLVEAHGEDYAAVGPVMRNGNPESALSWANLLIEYGPWMHADAPADAEHLPGHNSTYKRDLLLAYGDDLADMLEAETLLHWDLRARGHRLLHTPAARTHHVNYSRWLHSLRLRYLA
ncbi:MAG: glycosyltransferase, partial [Rhodothermales bacterium]|nr:glycosyltransferase [Rhodothermales bacterium]